MKKSSSNSKREVIGNYVLDYKNIYIAILLIVAIFEMIMIIRGFFIFDFSRPKNVGYMVSYFVLLIVSLIIGSILFIFKNMSPKTTAYLVHVYSGVIIFWATAITILEGNYGDAPLVYLTIIYSIGTVTIIHPIVYSVLVVLSYSIILINSFINHAVVSSGTIINTAVFIIIAFIITLKMYKVSTNEANLKAELKKANVTDILTGLGNELSYFSTIEKIDKMYRNYAIVVMDLNGLKYTDDTYGHDYGCHLIVETGKILPTIFPTSHLYHIGGDEFVAIVVGDDYDNIAERIEKFDATLKYSTIKYLDQELILSIARGVAIKSDYSNYIATFHQADKSMYSNKRKIKKQFNISSRKEN